MNTPNTLNIDLTNGQRAAMAGDAAGARACFVRVVQSDPRNETALLWLSAVMPTLEQGLRVIEHLLDINPRHERALQAKSTFQEQLTVEAHQPLGDLPPTLDTPQAILLGETLVNAGLITQEQLRAALREQVQAQLLHQPRRLGEILVGRRMIRPEQLEAVLRGEVVQLAH